MISFLGVAAFAVGGLILYLWLAHRRRAAAIVTLGIALLLRPVCMPIPEESLATFNTPVEQRTDRDLYLRVFQRRGDQWHQCKTYVSHQFFFQGRMQARMTGQPIDQTGGCLCGAVRFRAQGVPKWVAHCHCPSCRRQTGAAFATYAGYKAADFVLTDGQPAAHQSSPGVTRRFCATCGTPLTYESDRWPGEVHVLIGAMDAPAAFTPQAHVYVTHKLSWLRLDDSLPRYAASSAEGAPL